MSFDADILHIPSGLIIAVDNNGRRDENDYGVVSPKRDRDIPASVRESIMKEWDNFAHRCLPLLRAEAKSSDYPVFRDIWDGDDHRIEYIRDSVFEFFLSEHQIQQSYGRKRNVVVRMDNDGQVFTYKTNDPATLMGRVAGSYWDKKVKNWVKL